MCFVFSLNAPKEYGNVVDKLTPLELMELNWSKFYTKCHQQLQYKNHWPFNNPGSLNTGCDVSWCFLQLPAYKSRFTVHFISLKATYVYDHLFFRSQCIASPSLWDFSSFGKVWLPLLSYKTVCHNTWQPSVQQVVDWPAFLHCVRKNYKITNATLYIQKWFFVIDSYIYIAGNAASHVQMCVLRQRVHATIIS